MARARILQFEAVKSRLNMEKYIIEDHVFSIIKYHMWWSFGINGSEVSSKFNGSTFKEHEPLQMIPLRISILFGYGNFEICDSLLL